MNDKITENWNELLTDKEWRKKLKQDPTLALAKMTSQVEVVVKTNTKETFYFVLPNSANYFSVDNLDNIHAADTHLASTGSVGSLTSASTIGCVGVCVSSASTGSTVGSASTVKT